MCKIDDGVVNVAAILCNPALLEPHLKTSIDREEEFGSKIFIKVFLCIETDRCRSIIVCRARRHWEPMLSSPKKMSFAMVNIFSCTIMSHTLVGAFTSCLLDALISSTVIPLPWVRTSWRRRWRFFCLSIRMGSTSEKEKGLWLLGVSALDQRKTPRYMLAV